MGVCYAGTERISAEQDEGGCAESRHLDRRHRRRSSHLSRRSVVVLRVLRIQNRLAWFCVPDLISIPCLLALRGGPTGFNEIIFFYNNKNNAEYVAWIAHY